jgi:hypothetical protein
MPRPSDLPPSSGPDPGEHLAAFIVDDVTGKFPGERLCYVCHFGEGPVVLVFARAVDEELAALGKGLDAWRARHPGAEAFIAVSSPDPEGDREALQELAAEHGLCLPLTLCSEGEFGPHLYRLHPRVPLTVVLYREKTVAAVLTADAPTHDFRAEVLARAELLTAHSTSGRGLAVAPK